MFSKTALFISALAVSAMAAPGGAPGTVNQCNTGPTHCCNSVKSASDASIAGILAPIAALVGPITGQVGLTCSPISVIGVAGNSCSAQPVCCTGNNFNGAVVLGCSPVNANL